MNYQMIRYVISRILWTEAVLLLLPLGTALVYGESTLPFLETMLALTAAGLLLGRKPKQTALYARDGFAVVALAWVECLFLARCPLCSPAIFRILSTRFLKPSPVLPQPAQPS